MEIAPETDTARRRAVQIGRNLPLRRPAACRVPTGVAPRPPHLSSYDDEAGAASATRNKAPEARHIRGCKPFLIDSYQFAAANFSTEESNSSSAARSSNRPRTTTARIRDVL